MTICPKCAEEAAKLCANLAGDGSKPTDRLIGYDECAAAIRAYAEAQQARLRELEKPGHVCEKRALLEKLMRVSDTNTVGDKDIQEHVFYCHDIMRETISILRKELR